VAGVLVVAGVVALAIVMMRAIGVPRETEKAIARVLVFGVLGSLLFIFFGRARRHEAPSARQLLERDPRPPVLYLRCFRSDQQTRQLLGSLTEEEQVAEVLQDVGPVIAVGRPGEPLPELGAARFYVEDARWRATVAALLERSALVVLLTGDTEALAWEVERAAAAIPPERLLFLVPRDEPVYEAFRARAAPLLGVELPPLPATRTWTGSLAGVVRFEADWTPRLEPLRPVGFFRGSRNRPVSARFRATVRPVFDALGVAWEPPAVNAYRVLVVVLLGASAVGSTIAILLGG
jgi:hypothetical protein